MNAGGNKLEKVFESVMIMNFFMSIYFAQLMFGIYERIILPIKELFTPYISGCIKACPSFYKIYKADNVKLIGCKIIIPSSNYPSSRNIYIQRSSIGLVKKDLVCMNKQIDGVWNFALGMKTVIDRVSRNSNNFNITSNELNKNLLGAE